LHVVSKGIYIPSDAMVKVQCFKSISSIVDAHHYPGVRVLILFKGGVVSAYFDEADFTSQRSSLTLYDNYQIGGSAESDSYFEGNAFTVISSH